MPPLIILEEYNALNSGDESDYYPMSTDVLEDISNRNQSHPNVNRRDTHYKIRDQIF